jgi:hypothetical protein
MLQHKFVEFIPNLIEEGILYISVDYCTAIHKCVCGCGNEVVTPLSPTDWRLNFDGKTISLYPSIGNWNFDCQSHYWITKNRIEYSKSWSKKEIKMGRDKDSEAKKEFFKSDHKTEVETKIATEPIKISLWQHVFKIIGI